MADVTAHPGPGTATDRAKGLAQRAERGALRSTTRFASPAVVLVGPPGSGKSSVGAAHRPVTGLHVPRHRHRHRATRGPEHPGHLPRGRRAALPRARTGRGARGAGRAHRRTGPRRRARFSPTRPGRALLGHQVVFLNLSMPTGVKRTGLAVNRPLLAGVNPRATYRALLEARLVHYRETARFESADRRPDRRRRGANASSTSWQLR